MKSDLDDSFIIDQFNAAVSLVKSLPKKGSFSPSYSEAAKIYSLFKQSKFGPCKSARPGFWDVINRTKWDAWSALGNMSQEEAMKDYVEEIKKMYHQFQASSDLLENQNEYAHTIIPFCKATGIELPKSLAKLVQEEEKGNEIFLASKQKEQNKLVEENIKHGTNSSEKNNTEKSSITEEIKSAATIEKVICEKKTVEFEEKDNGMLSNMCNDDMKTPTSSSDEEDIYCDSLDPDQVSCLMETKRNENEKASSDVEKVLEKQEISDINTSFQIDPCKPPVKICPVSSTETSKSEFEIVEKFPLCSVDLRKGKFCTKRYKKYRSAEDFFRHYYYKSHNKKSRKRLHNTNKRYEIEHLEDQNCKAAMQFAINFGDVGTNSSSKNEEFYLESKKQSVLAKQSLEHQHVSRHNHSRSPSTSDHSPNESSFTSSSTGDVELIILQALERMDHNLHQLLHRMRSLEHNMEVVVENHRLPWWWQLAPNKATLFWIAWPILVNLIFSIFWRRKLKQIKPKKVQENGKHGMLSILA